MGGSLFASFWMCQYLKLIIRWAIPQKILIRKILSSYKQPANILSIDFDNSMCHWIVSLRDTGHDLSPLQSLRCSLYLAVKTSVRLTKFYLDKECRPMILVGRGRYCRLLFRFRKLRGRMTAYVPEALLLKIRSADWEGK